MARRGKVIFLSYSPWGGHHIDIEVFELLNCGIAVVD